MAVMIVIMPISSGYGGIKKKSYLLKVSMYVDNIRGEILSDLWC
jgi:hypothetical protein